MVHKQYREVGGKEVLGDGGRWGKGGGDDTRPVVHLFLWGCLVNILTDELISKL